ncbi:probable flavin-containing monooxygenase 1 [Salvia miltiorrhiza]|uniref:probable flavin-containing monooxygenase 1 n=1 Tax=Salvia miltiorrhiza TaxID=226208 RepID=UPI0025AC7DE7|nr:probable flavin-containing monooxygenase 1 [Salvia miltiorrhiza]
MEKRVAIVGAGVSGLLACKYASAKGFTPMVFEEQDEVGGLWNHTLESTTLQITKHLYEFSDFPWPSSVPEETPPHNTQLVEYLQSYAHKFQLLQYVNFKCKVIDVDYVGESENEMRSWDLWGGDGKAFGSKGKWILRVSHAGDDSIKEYEAEFLVLCIGRFSGLPNFPEFAPGYGAEAFSGKVMHSMDFSNMDNAAAAQFIKGKRVAVIGAGKSAIDIAFECANVNGRDKPCTMIQRGAHWMLPHHAHSWGLTDFLIFTRFVELMLHKPGEGFLSGAIATLLTPVRWGLNRLVESFIKWQMPLKKYDMIPKESFVREVSSCQIILLQPHFFDKVEDGSIVMRKSQNFTFCKEGLILDGEGVPLQVDIVIFATGYKGDEKLKNMFASPTFQNYIEGSPTSTIPLYRQIIHPRIPQLAVIGYSESLSNIFSFEMRCKWLSHFLDGAFALPSMGAMEKEIEAWEKFMKRYAGNKEFRRSCIGGVPIWYNDQICKDIGSSPRRKKGFFSELFEPYYATDYRGL